MCNKKNWDVVAECIHWVEGKVGEMVWEFRDDGWSERPPGRFCDVQQSSSRLLFIGDGVVIQFHATLDFKLISGFQFS
jgi:hypothetical protein